MVALVTMWSRGKTLSTLPCESLQFRRRSSSQANARAKPLNIDVIPPKPGMPTPRAALAALEAAPAAGNASQEARPRTRKAVHAAKCGCEGERACWSQGRSRLGLTHKSDFCDCRDCSAIG